MNTVKLTLADGGQYEANADAWARLSLKEWKAIYGDRFNEDVYYKVTGKDKPAAKRSTKKSRNSAED